MKTKLLLIPFCLLCAFNFTSCGEKKEDGNIQDWVGEYKWVSNKKEHWHHNVIGDPTHIRTEEYRTDKDVNLSIKEDKTWIMPDLKGPGKSGKVRCYKNYINLLGLSTADYCISSNFNFKFIYSEETSNKWLRYEKDGSSGRSRGDYDYTIRVVEFIFVNKI